MESTTACTKQWAQHFENWNWDHWRHIFFTHDDRMCLSHDNNRIWIEPLKGWYMQLRKSSEGEVLSSYWFIIDSSLIEIYYSNSHCRAGLSENRPEFILQMIIPKHMELAFPYLAHVQIEWLERPAPPPEMNSIHHGWDHTTWSLWGRGYPRTYWTWCRCSGRMKKPGQQRAV